MITAFERSLRQALGEDRVGTAVPLAPLTTFRVGGTAEYFVEARNDRGAVANSVRLVRPPHRP